VLNLAIGGDMAKELHPICARCARAVCYPAISAGEVPSLDEAPPFCPMRLFPDLLDAVMLEYEKAEVKEFARLASVQEFECYERTQEGLRTRFPRIEELVQFADKCGYRRLGIAFCLGLRNEAGILTDILESKGFDVISVCCKCGAVAKERIGIRPEQKIGGSDLWESMCNPIMQAEVLNAERVDLAILLGLCIGHDTLLIKYCRVPMTVLAVKDRVTGHNPLAALYLSQSVYYRRLLRKRARTGDEDQRLRR
jgi:uncharacterized metal-binding protein